MPIFLKISRVNLAPETYTAFEYESERYMSWAHARTIPAIQWESGPVKIDELVVLLESRGWHQTDIGDELDEARKAPGLEA